MGYQVYEDDYGRWAGYGVPAVCDWPACDTEIDRGLAYKCEEHVTLTDDDAERVEAGCGLFFCPEHQYAGPEHDGADVKTKPDTAEWVDFMLTDDSWEQWRADHPARVAQMRTPVH